MKKRVNVYCGTPFVIGPAAFAGTCENIVLETKDISTCIMYKAKVEEILADGTTIPLDFTNYDKNNGVSDVTENDAPITDKRKHSKPVIEVVDAVKPAPAVSEVKTTIKVEKNEEVEAENSAEPVAVVEEKSTTPDTNSDKNKYNKFKKSNRN